MNRTQSIILKEKFGTKFPTQNTICHECGKPFSAHEGWKCPENKT